MSDDFYMTVATVLPVLLLALIWNSRLLENVRQQERKLRKADPLHGVLFWTKGRVRLYTLFVTAVIMVAIGLCVLELGGALPNRLPLRLFMIAAVALTLGTLTTRIWVDVIAATVDDVPAAAGGAAADVGAAAAGNAESGGR